MRTLLLAVCLSAATCMATGCVNARAPENIYIGGSGPQPADVDSSRVPDTQTHEQARAELVKAYRQIRYLEHEHARCQRKLEKARERGDDYKRKYKRLKDRLDD